MKKFKHIIENYAQWNDNIINFLKDFYSEKLPEFLDDTKTFYKQKQIYILFAKNYNNMIVRFDTREKFIDALQLAFIEFLPQLYVSSIAFVNDEFQKLLEEENRGDKQSGSSLGSGKQKNKQGIPPSDLKVKDDLAELNIKNAEFMENFNKTETTAQATNLLANLKQIINSKITSKIFDWLNNFTKLFTPLVCDEFNWTEQLTDILHELRKEVDELSNVIDANKLQDVYNELQRHLQDLKNELDEAIKNATNQNIATLQANIKALETKYNAEIRKIWDYLDDNDGLLKKFEELYNQLRTEMESIENRVEAIEDMNFALQDRENNFIAPQNVKNGRGTTILRVTQSTTDNSGGLNNPNGRLLIGGKNGVEINSTIKYVSSTAITQDNQFTTKEYVDNAINQFNWDSIDTSNFAKINENNSFLVTQNFLNATLDNVLDNGLSLVNKDYIHEVKRTIEQEAQQRFQSIVDWIVWGFTSGDIAANTFTINTSRFNGNHLLEVYVYTDDGFGKHKYITCKSYVWDNDTTLRIFLNENIIPKTPFKCMIRKVGTR